MLLAPRKSSFLNLSSSHPAYSCLATIGVAAVAAGGLYSVSTQSALKGSFRNPFRSSSSVSTSATSSSTPSSVSTLSVLNNKLATSINMEIYPLQARSDNWMYLIVDTPTNSAAVVDPYDWKKMLALVKEKGVNVTTLLTTHHHDDHSGGNLNFLSHHPHGSSITAYGGSSSPGTNTLIKDGSKFKIGQGIQVKCLHTPCHTQDSICYYLEDGKGGRAVFTGDTLFQAGCGRFFEGTPAEMHKALSYLGTLPDDTVVYNGHEYTRSSAKFGMSVEKKNGDIKKLAELAQTTDCTTGKTTIGDEKKWNVFMRLNEEDVKAATGESDPVRVMGKLREMKNSI